MEQFLIKWFLSLIVGVIFVAVFTSVAERIGGKIGGLLLGLPSTAVVSLLFIGITQGNDAAVTASIVLPFSTGLYCFFFMVYLSFKGKSFYKGLFLALSVWFLFAFIASKVSPHGIFWSVVFWVVLVVSSITYVVKKIKIRPEFIPAEIKKSPIWLKALLSGLVISTVVLISKFAGPKWGGIFATFPAVTVSSLLITAKSGGFEFTRLVIKNVLISNTTTLGIFAISSYFLIPIVGILWGIFLAYIILLTISLPLYFLVLDKLKD